MSLNFLVSLRISSLMVNSSFFLFDVPVHPDELRDVA